MSYLRLATLAGTILGACTVGALINGCKLDEEDPEDSPTPQPRQFEITGYTTYCSDPAESATCTDYGTIPLTTTEGHVGPFPVTFIVSGYQQLRGSAGQDSYCLGGSQSLNFNDDPDSNTTPVVITTESSPDCTNPTTSSYFRFGEDPILQLYATVQNPHCTNTEPILLTLLGTDPDGTLNCPDSSGTNCLFSGSQTFCGGTLSTQFSVYPDYVPENQ